MKRTVIVLAGLLVISVLASCNRTQTTGDVETVQVAEESVADSPVGTWTGNENGKRMQFVFNEDGTGYENYQDEENRPFTWVLKDDGPYIIYENQPNEWKIQGYNPEEGTITYGALVYSRE
jgi:predicted small secreted protein